MNETIDLDQKYQELKVKISDEEIRAKAGTDYYSFCVLTGNKKALDNTPQQAHEIDKANGGFMIQTTHPTLPSGALTKNPDLLLASAYMALGYDKEKTLNAFKSDSEMINDENVKNILKLLTNSVDNAYLDKVIDKYETFLEYAKIREEIFNREYDDYALEAVLIMKANDVSIDEAYRTISNRYAEKHREAGCVPVPIRKSHFMEAYDRIKAA